MLSTRVEGELSWEWGEVNRPKIFPFILMSSVASSFCVVLLLCAVNIVFILWFIKIITFAHISHII
jgi:hypothetical protein